MPAILAIVSIIAVTLLGFSNPFAGGRNQTTDNWIDPNSVDKASCQPNIDISRTMQVNVDDELNSVYVNNPDHPEFNKEGEQWILIKARAPIPAWKVILYEQGTRAGKPFGEMEKMGVAVTNSSNPDNNKDVYIGTGWCDPVIGDSFSWGDANYDRNACLDPLTQDVLFVVDNKGAETVTEDFLLDRDWANAENPNPPKTQDNINKYWWTFNVYYKASKLPANPTVADLPCWIRELANQCPGAGDAHGNNRYNASNAPNCEESVLGASDPDPRATIHSDTTLVITAPLPQGVTLAEDYIFVKETNIAPDGDPIIGSAYNDHFRVRLRLGTIEAASTDHTIILDARPDHPGTYYVYAPILGASQPDNAATLQLGSFFPGIPSFFYEWWTPACKPAIYLYPEQETEIAVKVKPEGFITESIPEHGTNGWNVIAKPNGSLTTLDNKPLELGYLYYEAALNKVHVPKDRGWIRNTEELPAFFSSTLSKLGLNEKERLDFVEYWVPKLQEGDKWFITLIDSKELDRVEPIEFSKTPDNFIRVRFYFEKLDNNTKDLSSLAKYEIPNTIYERHGFTAVDWGGIIGNGSCGIEEKSE